MQPLFRSLLVAIISLALQSTSAIAEELQCAAISPCDESGVILKEWDSGPCAEIFRARCALIASERVAGDLHLCRSERAATVQKLLSDLQRSERQLRIARARLRAR